MVVRRAGLLLLLLLLPLAARAQPAPPAAAAACPPRGTPVVRVEVSDPEPRILSPLPARELRERAGSAEDGLFPDHLGLTLSRVEWRSEITVRSLAPTGAQGADGPVCVLPAEVRLALVHAEHSIRLAREVPRGGCLAGEVLAHERRHVQVNRRTLREAVPELRNAARAWAARAEARTEDVAAGALQLQEELAGAVEPVLARLRAARERGHAAIDSPAEYRRLGRVCPEDQKKLRTALRRG
jgi:hypothetical protein